MCKLRICLRCFQHLFQDRWTQSDQCDSALIPHISCFRRCCLPLIAQIHHSPRWFFLHLLTSTLSLLDQLFPLHSYKSFRSRSSTTYSSTTSLTISMATQSPSQSGQGGANKKSSSLPQKATVTSLAGVEGSRTSTISSIDHSILERIKKCLSRANHPNTAELEAKTAWHMASRLMAEHNVTQADVLAQVTNDEDLAQMGGESTVAITNPNNPTRVINYTWVDSNCLGNVGDVRLFLLLDPTSHFCEVGVLWNCSQYCTNSYGFRNGTQPYPGVG